MAGPATAVEQMIAGRQALGEPREIGELPRFHLAGGLEGVGDDVVAGDGGVPQVETAVGGHGARHHAAADSRSPAMR